jgi:hypothetical protein
MRFRVILWCFVLFSSSLFGEEISLRRYPNPFKKMPLLCLKQDLKRKIKLYRSTQKQIPTYNDILKIISGRLEHMIKHINLILNRFGDKKEDLLVHVTFAQEGIDLSRLLVDILFFLGFKQIHLVIIGDYYEKTTTQNLNNTGLSVFNCTSIDSFLNTGIKGHSFAMLDDMDNIQRCFAIDNPVITMLV